MIVFRRGSISRGGYSAKNSEIWMILPLIFTLFKNLFIAIDKLPNLHSKSSDTYSPFDFIFSAGNGHFKKIYFNYDLTIKKIAIKFKSFKN